jgi:hypothetical protein
LHSECLVGSDCDDDVGDVRLKREPGDGIQDQDRTAVGADGVSKASSWIRSATLPLDNALKRMIGMHGGGDSA